MCRPTSVQQRPNVIDWHNLAYYLYCIELRLWLGLICVALQVFNKAKHIAGGVNHK